jgi:hypothetical protein
VQSADLIQTLVWKGSDSVEYRAMDLHVCDYLGCSGDHLCFNDGDPQSGAGFTAGVIKFLDKTYNPVGDNFTAVNNLEGPDLHELHTPNGYNGEIFLQDVYHSVPADLSSIGGAKDGFAVSGCFQEIDIASRNETFQWCSLDHIPVTESTFPFDPKADTKSKPFDYFHLNSIDKDENGDYMVSSRHCDAIYKIAGMKSSNPGDVIWRLGGKNNSFTNEGSFNFSRQHMARFQGTSGSVTNISLFDNGADGGLSPTTVSASSGMIVSLDTDKKTAALLEQYIHPEGHISASQGSFQLLSNGNRFLGWGADAALSEYAPNGDVLYHARFAQNSYRAFRAPWSGYPTARPDVVAYAQNCSAPITAYMSWNGATDVKSWSVYAGNSTDTGFHLAGGSEKTGFETNITLSPAGFNRYVYAEAKDAAGNVLNATDALPVWIPNAILAKQCNETMCPTGSTNYTSADSGSC